MRKQVWAPALLLGIGVVLGSLALAQQPTDKTIAGLIDKLGSGDFEDREQAEQELDKLGLKAIDALKQAAKSEDAEVRRRAEDLVAKIEKREASALILRPTRVTLSLKDAPVAEAIAALRKQTDFAIQLHDPEEKAKDVKVTLELKDVAFWEALAALCDKAGLAETNVAQAGAIGGVGRPIRPIRIAPGVKPIPVPLPIQIDPAVPPDQPPPAKPVPPKPEEGFAVGEDAAVPPPAQDLPAVAPPPPPLPPVQVAPGAQVIIRGQGVIIGGGAPGMPFPGGMPSAPGLIVLTPAKIDKLPADLATSFRVRAVPNQFQVQIPGQTLHTVTLEVTPEPRFQFAGHDKVAIKKAIDDQDQNLAEFDPNQPFAVPGGGIGIALPAGRVMPGFPGFGGGFAGGTTLPIYLKAGEKAAKSLKELSGTIAARIHVPHSKPIVVEKVLDAAGKTFKGEKGGEVKILTVQKAGDSVTLRFELVTPKDAVGGENGGEGIFPVPGIQFGGVAPAILPVVPPLPAPVPVPVPVPDKPEGFAVEAEEKLIPLPPPPVAAQAAGPIQVQVAPAIAQVQIGGPGMVVGFGGMPSGLRLLDEKGNPVVIQGVQQQWNAGPNGPAQVIWQLQIAQGKDQPKLDKLTWQLQKAASVDVPFTLKNVPLN